MEAWLMWVILAVFFCIAEIFTAGFFLLWFGIGAGVSALLAYFGVSSGLQFLTFSIVSLILFFLSRKFADKITGEQPAGIGADRMIGKQGIVLEEVDNHKNTGKARFDKEEWRVDSLDDKVIPVGTRIETVKVDGTKMIVKEI